MDRFMLLDGVGTHLDGQIPHFKGYANIWIDNSDMSKLFNSTIG